jgi:predicted nucleic acid-binding protein
MWIAATALVHGMAVVTKNLDEFQRVAGLHVVAF